MTKNLKLIRTLEKISVLMVAALGILMPTFYLTTTTEFFEFNKMALLTVATLILLGILVAKVAIGGGIPFRKTGIDAAVLVFMSAFLLSTLFSVDKTASIWGAQNRWFPSVFGLFTLVLFYYISAPNFTSKSQIKLALYAFVTGATISSIVATLSYFKIFIGQAAFMHVDSFTLVGSPTTAVILATIAMVIAFYSTYKENFLPVRALLITATVVNFAFAALAGKPFVWVLITAGMALSMYALNPQRVLADRFISMILLTALISVAMLTLFPSTKDIIKNKNYNYELSLPIRQSWVIATASIQDYPLLATGPSTFAINFSNYRPLSMNNSQIWNIRFDKPYNEFFNVMATLGVIGLLTYIFFWIKSFKLAITNFFAQDQTGVSNVLAIATILTLISYFFTYATVFNTFMLFFFLALMAASYATTNAGPAEESEVFSFTSLTAVTATVGDSSAISKEYANVIAIAPFVLMVVFGVYLFGRNYLGEYYMRRAIVLATENQVVQAYDYQTKAINVNAKRSAYHSAYAQTNLAIANAMAANETLSDQDKQNIQTLVSQAIRSTRVATEVINSLNVPDWETRALVYRALLNTADNAHEWAVGAYNTAIRLEPSNPALRVDLGGIYYIKGDFLAAANMFRQATTLKPDYANAHYNLAQAFVNLQDFDNAKRELELTKGLVEKGSEDFKIVEQQIAALNIQAPAVAGATAGTGPAKPSIEELIGGNSVQQAQQEPLSGPNGNTNAENLNPEVLPQGEGQPAR